MCRKSSWGKTSPNGSLRIPDAPEMVIAISLSRGVFRVFAQTKLSVLLGFTLAAYSLDRVRGFRSKQAEDEAKPLRRAKRRQGTWRDYISRKGDPVSPSATNPPG